ncbi:MAG: tetratricopeptide repeat protein [Candidatus Accumulibacter phosphatis]|uniref:tetratricopeptide repeat protein n=1 Tax=Candidatus Accumulibacter phosphatis TaxID=327160 RepID=UPI001A5A8A75|nr:tetratricopeptide repeat protein [Candidatus Accumulibacter phosphatis]
MSLLMDALRRAEEAKRLATPGSRAEAVAGELSLDPLEATPAPPDTPLPPLSRHLDTIDADLAAAATAPSSPRRAPPTEGVPADNGAREAAERRAARNVFAAKPVPASRTPLWLFLGLLGLATMAIVGYFWWQLQSVGRGSLTQPATPLPTAGPTPPPALQASPTPALPPVAVAPPPVVPPPVPTEASRPPQAASGAVGSTRRAERAGREPAGVPVAEVAGVFRLNDSRPRHGQTIEHAYDALQANRLDDARSGYEQVLRGDPRNADALLGLAVIATRQGQTERAQQIYLRVLEVNPGDATAQAALINLRGQSDSGQSESRLKILLASQPDSPSLHFALGNLYARQGRWSEAQQAYFQAYALEPDNADTLFNIAVSLDHLRQNKLAAQYYRMALNAAETRRSAFDQNAVGKRLLELQQ